MALQSTRNKSLNDSWHTAVLRGLAPDGGLYTPRQLPSWDANTIASWRSFSFPELAETLARGFLGSEVEPEVLSRICRDSFTFPIPLQKLDDQTFVLELFRGPTAAFKDFGARFMARLFRHFWGSQDKPLIVLAATSGDTGSAVANAFFDTSPHPPIRVAVLFPRGKVSDVQRKQMTTLGHNVTAFEVDGTFDDCQALVKRALADSALQEQSAFTSANSINIARLLPQMFYYVYARLQFPDDTPPIFSVPSGNLGNLTGGLLAHLCGSKSARFISACNANRTFPEFLRSGSYQPIPSLETISNAMDVGDPSNFYRVTELLGQDAASVRDLVEGFSITDAETTETMRSVHERYRYVADPHTAVGIRALELYRAEQRDFQTPGVVLATAHPAKFSNTVRNAIGVDPDVPPSLTESLSKQERSTSLSKDYASLARHLSALSRD